MPKKVLIVVYYWPPSGGIAVQRWLSMVTYLRDGGWEPVIIAPDGADYPIIEEDLFGLIPAGIKIIKIPIWEVRNIYRKIFNRRGKADVKPDDLFFTDPRKRSWKEKFALWIRGNIFIPDARVTWVRPVTFFLKGYLKENAFDAIITTGPPHSIHLIGKNVKKLFPEIFWMADFRDPWTAIEYHEKMLLSKWAKKKHFYLEGQVIGNADIVTTVSKSWASDFVKKGASKVEIIINGYEEKDFMKGERESRTKFNICHAGTMVNDRWIGTFWRAVAELKKENPEFSEAIEITIVGRTDKSIWDGFEELGLIACVRNLGLKSHTEAIREMKSAEVLLLIINQSEANFRGRLTGKIYEYMAAQRPIVLVGPTDGDAAELIESERTGVAIGYEDKNKAKYELLRLFREWKTELKEHEKRDISYFTRRFAADKVIEILNRELD